MIYQTGHENKEHGVMKAVSCPVYGEVTLSVCLGCSYQVEVEVLMDRKGQPKKEQVICSAPLARVVREIKIITPRVEPSTTISAPTRWHKIRRFIGAAFGAAIMAGR